MPREKNIVKQLQSRETSGKKIDPKINRVLAEQLKPFKGMSLGDMNIIHSIEGFVRGQPRVRMNPAIEALIRPPQGSLLGQNPPPEYKKGGKIKKTGLVKAHKGEVVVPAHRVKTVDKALKQAGMKPLKK